MKIIRHKKSTNLDFEIFWFLTYIRDSDQHSFSKLDLDPDPHSTKKLDPDHENLQKISEFLHDFQFKSASIVNVWLFYYRIVFVWILNPYLL
jgi:hypothetical protein